MTNQADPSSKERIEVRDWYQFPATDAACVIMIEPGADLSPYQVRKVRNACPNWTRDVEEYAQNNDGTIRYRVRKDSDS